MWGFPFNISATAEASDLKFGTQLGFAKAHHKITPRRKSVGGLQLGELPIILGSPIIFLQQLGLATFHTHRIKWAWPWIREVPIYLGFLFNISATATLSS